jgi:hypothetical protein
MSSFKILRTREKESGSQNFSFLALKAEAVSEVQILRTATTTARDRRIFLSLKKSPKKGAKIIFHFSRHHHIP